MGKAGWMGLVEAARLARRRTRVFLGGCLAEPAALLDCVAAEPLVWQDLTLTGAFVPGVNGRDFSALGQGTRVETIFLTEGLRAGAAEGRVKILPLGYSGFMSRLAAPGLVDLAVFAVPPPRADGTVGLGPTVDFVPALTEAGARLVGVVNPALPDMPGGPRLPLARFEALAEGFSPLPPYEAGGAEPALDRIAALVAEEIRPGDTVQLGIGKLQAAVLAALAGRRDLGFHAGMVSPPILPLLEAGVFSRGTTTGVALGDEVFLRALAGRSDLRFAPVSETHGAAALAALPRLVAVNTVLEVDLWGQANAEFAGGRQSGGVGGLNDFLRGAQASRGGRSILALPSTARRGTVSRIVPALSGPVSVARSDIDMVVTEWGKVSLPGCGVAERACALIELAAPAFREHLAESWKAMQA